MPANAYIKSFDLGGAGWTRLADAATVLQATIIADTQNANPINLRFRGGAPAEWPPGAAASFASVDLSEIEVQGDSGHRLLVAGYAPGNRPRGRGVARLVPPAQPYISVPGDIGGGGGGGGF